MKATRNQVEASFGEIFTTYPSLREWLTKTARDANESFDAWVRMLAGKVHPEDLEEVTRQIVDGEVDPRGKYDKPDALPMIIRSRCNFLEGERQRMKRQDVLHEQAHARDPKRVAPFFALLNRKRLGEDVEDELLQEHLRLKETDAADAPRYKCDQCRDTGLVEVLCAKETVEALRDGAESLRKYDFLRSTMLACHCGKAEHFRDGVQTEKYRYQRLRRYEAERYFHAVAIDHSHLEQLEAWCVNRRLVLSEQNGALLEGQS